MIEKIKKLIEKPINDKGYILDDVIYEKEEGNYFLRVVIDKSGFVVIEDCVIVSQTINPLLDEVSELDKSYILDVSSKEKGDERGQ